MAAYVLQSFLRQTSIVCVNSGCETVRKSTASYPFGIPVPAFGLVGYSLLALGAFLRTMKTHLEKTLLTGMLAVATFGVAFVSWFTYTEIYVIGAVCTWCAISAANMAIIFILTVKSYYLGGKIK